jgi:hypothetical protein
MEHQGETNLEEHISMLVHHSSRYSLDFACLGEQAVELEMVDELLVWCDIGIGHPHHRAVVDSILEGSCSLEAILLIDHAHVKISRGPTNSVCDLPWSLGWNQSGAAPLR